MKKEASHGSRGKRNWEKKSGSAKAANPSPEIHSIYKTNSKLTDRVFDRGKVDHKKKEGKGGNRPGKGKQSAAGTASRSIKQRF